MTFLFVVVVLLLLDPATVNRSPELAMGEIGAGQTRATQTIEEGGTVTLVCPTSGIDDPQTNWTYITTNMAGLVEEVPIDAADPALSVRYCVKEVFSGFCPCWSA